MVVGDSPLGRTGGGFWTRRVGIEAGGGKKQLESQVQANRASALRPGSVPDELM